MNSSLEAILAMAAPGVRGLRPYEPGKPVSELQREYGLTDIIKLASNENPMGPSPHALEAMRKELEQLARYPDGNSFDLKSALTKRHGVAPKCVTVGNGSNDLLELVARAFVTPADEVVFSQHSFAVYPIVTQAVGATARIADAHDGSEGPDFGHDLKAMAECVNDKTRLVFVANPNNPTGTWLPGDELEAFIADMPSHVIVVVDEAYFEYVHETAYRDSVPLVERYPNLMVTRTFSKAFGLAGLRVGYSVSRPEVADILNRVRQPFNVNSMAQVGALAALDDTAYLQASVALNTDGMRQLEEAFRVMGLAFIPSVANFICVEVGDSGLVYEALLREGIIVRPVANYGMPKHLRITVGTAQQNARFVTALAKVLGCKAPV